MRGGNSALNIKKKREGKGASQTDSWVRALPPACCIWITRGQQRPQHQKEKGGHGPDRLVGNRQHPLRADPDIGLRPPDSGFRVYATWQRAQHQGQKGEKGGKPDRLEGDLPNPIPGVLFLTSGGAFQI